LFLHSPHHDVDSAPVMYPEAHVNRSEKRHHDNVQREEPGTRKDGAMEVRIDVLAGSPT
jgi:hypothetical protein